MISVLTSTYNRGYILSNLYNSLTRQTCQDFEWVIVDDGSNDNTSDIVNKWIHEPNGFIIKYIKKSNTGKHKSINVAVGMAESNYCIIVDSDDYFTDDAIEKIYIWLESISGERNFAGVSGLKGYISGGLIGGYPNLKNEFGYIDATNLDRRKLDLLGDKAEIYKTELLKKYPFPEFEGEKFISEEIVWDAIASAGYRIRWFNEIIIRCEYLADGLTCGSRQHFLQSFVGYTYATKEKIALHDYYEGLIVIGEYRSISRQKGLSREEVLVNLDISPLRYSLAMAICYFRNSIKYLIRKMR